MSSRDEKRVLREAKDFVKTNARHVKKARDVSSGARSRVEDELNELRQAIADKDVDRIKSTRAAIDKLLDEHFDIQEKSAFREYAESIGLAVLFALVLRGFVFEAFKIPTGSMIPTLLVGDHIFVNKFIYGIRIPFTETYLAEFARPERGEVIVFTFPREEARAHIADQPVQLRSCIDPGSLQEEKDFIKRVVAVGGDTLEIRDHLVYINGEPLARKRLSEEPTNRYMSPMEVRERETNDGFTYTVQFQADRTSDDGDVDPGKGHGDFGPVKIEERHVFVMGDHRDHSSDSRCWGQVPVNNVKGRAIFIWFSIGDRGIRWNRLGHFIH